MFGILILSMPEGGMDVQGKNLVQVNVNPQDKKFLRYGSSGENVDYSAIPILKAETSPIPQPDAAIFGLAGNPPTIGHLHTIEKILEIVKPKVLEILLTHKHKTKKTIPFIGHRVQMVSEMVHEMIKKMIDKKIPSPETKVKPGLSEMYLSGFAIDTVNDRLSVHVKNLENNLGEKPKEIAWIIGADNMVTLNQWTRWQELLSKCTFIVILRDQYDSRAVLEKAIPFEVRKYIIDNPDKVKGIFLIEEHPDDIYSDISSTKVREQLARVKTFRKGDPVPKIQGLTEKTVRYILQKPKLLEYYSGKNFSNIPEKSNFSTKNPP